MYKKLLLLLVILLVIGFGVQQNSPVPTQSIPAHPVVFFDQNTFYEGVEKAKENKQFSYHISGGIVPHHLFPGFIIADFFSRLSAQKPKTIIIIGPNHYERGDFKALSSLYGWETAFGIVEPNKQIIQSLVGDNVIKIDEDVLPNDHAVAAILPFIKYYLPDTKVVPILLSGFMTEAETRILSRNLLKHLDKDTIVVAAVDFSHYLTNHQAQQKDDVTLKVMKDFDYRQLFALNNDYLDSAPSIATLLNLMQMTGTTNMEILYHTNSGELQNNDNVETTSYFSITYY